MKLKITLFLLLTCILSANSQSARGILDKANMAYNKAEGIEASFTIKTEDVKNKTTYSQDGKALLEGNKFKIEVTDGITWFDGKTQWVYSKGSEEVNVSNPTGEELAGVSPAYLLNIYKTGFDLKYKGEKRENGKTSYVIDLVPQGGKSEFVRMTIYIEKTTNLFNAIKMYGRNGFNNHLIIKSTQTNKIFGNNTFAFPKKDYPNAEIIDLR